MGNTSSLRQMLQKKPVKVSSSEPDNGDSDDDDDGDDNSSDNILLEVDIHEGHAGVSEAEIINLIANDCKNDHERFTAVEKLFANIDNNDASLQLLPEAIRHESVLEYIKIQEKLVVRIRTSFLWGKNFGTGYVCMSSDEMMDYDNCPLQDCKYNSGQAHKCYGGLIVYTNKHIIRNNSEASCCKLDFFYYSENSLIDLDVMTDIDGSDSKSGDNVSSLSIAVNSEIIAPDNNLLGCDGKRGSSAVVNDGEMMNVESCQFGSEGNTISSMNVDNEVTAAAYFKLPSGDNSNENNIGDCGQEVNDNNGDAHFINSSGLHKGITGYGFFLRENQEDKDLVGLRILYHDPKLFTLIKRLSNLKIDAWSNIPKEIQLKMKRFAIIISHPHGWPKKISFGDLISLEEDVRGHVPTKVTKYNAMTCRGSSGAPVLTGHYSYRPFVHKGKIKDMGISHSY